MQDLTPLGLIIFAAFLAGLFGTGLLRRYALRRALLDIPNERSSHSRPTPRGGGLSVTLVILAAVIGCGINGDLSKSLLLALLPTLLLVGVTGWLEDHWSLTIFTRAGSYLLASLWFVVFSGGLTTVAVGSAALPLGVLNIPLLVLGLAWLTNLYNFMDGADALAGLQAVLAGLAGGLMLRYEGAGTLALLAGVAASACAGFLIWNRPPARIFMGDAGSCFLGFVFGVLAILGEREAGLPALLWVILLGFFIWDATLTLLMRFLRSERWYRAHRSHAYQRLLQLGWSHGRLAGAFLIYNVLVLWPLAAWGYRQREALPAAVLVSVLLTALTWGMIQWWYQRSGEAKS